MTPTQIARRSDALYADGTCGMTRRVLCDMVAQRESDLEDARAEFDKMDKWHSAELQAAMAENAKLRELLKAVWDDALQFDGFWDYVYDDGTIYSEDELPHYVKKLRELGIEVAE